MIDRSQNEIHCLDKSMVFKSTCQRHHSGYTKLVDVISGVIERPFDPMRKTPQNDTWIS